MNTAFPMYIHHVAIWTIDLEKEKEFFLKYFNCSSNKKYTNTANHFSSYFITFHNGAKIELMTKEGTKLPGHEDIQGLAHFAIDAGSREMVDELTSLLRRDGITISSMPRVTGDGFYESVILDPEGNRIEIVSG